MRKILIPLISLSILSGCSVHQAWNGDKKPGLSYVSIDKQGNVASNNKGAVLASETLQGFGVNDEDAEAFFELLQKNDERSTLFIWSSEYNGAMVNGSGSTCLQAASYARSTSISTDVSSSLLAAFGQIDLASGSETDKLLALNISEAITNLTTSSEQSTYLSAGLFGLCLLHANGGLTNEQVKASVAKLIESSALVTATEKSKSSKQPTKDSNEDKSMEKE